MYKLVVVAGKLRGKEYPLVDGENTLGRDDSNSIVVPVAGVSKKHLVITVTDDVAFLEDAGSSNGTFLNGKAIKKVTVKSGDKIAIPDTILQLVYVKEKKVIIKQKTAVSDEDDDNSFLDGGPMPTSLWGKPLYLFKNRLMPIFHGINEEYEWKVLFAIILSLFVVATISLTIFPVLNDSKQLLLAETAKRGGHYADEIGRINSRALEQKNLDRVDTNFLDSEDGVASYELFDLEGRIVRPMGKLNSYISDVFSIRSKEFFDKHRDMRVYQTQLDDGEIGIAKKIMAYNTSAGISEPVGIISIRFSPRSLAVVASKNTKAYLEALSTSALVALFFFGIIYFLTLRPLDEMRFQIEEALRGKRKGLEGRYLMSELLPLRRSINVLLQRIRELQNDGDEASFDEIEDDGPYITILSDFLEGAAGPVMVLNSQKLVQRLNLEAEDLTGIRESTATNMDLLDVCREKGFAATLIELCDDSANNSGTSRRGEYELMGDPYAIYVNALMGKDSFAKAYYISFVKEGS